jgi:adenosylcobinamide kinase/adenosylcobinamide-phosphate guanylyltransferase
MGAQVVYVATAEAGDEEMAARIARHQRGRPAAWRTVEAPRALDVAVERELRAGETALVDCLSVWLSNELLATSPPVAGDTVPEAAADALETALLDAVERLVAAAHARNGATVVVSNEVGSGVVPAFPLGRLYRDLLGRANQIVAAEATAVYLVVAGIAVDLRRLEAPPADGAR